MKHIYFAVTIKENEKYCSYVVKATENDNILSVLKIKNIISANIYPKNKAEQVVKHWNECYKNNGTHMYSEQLF